MKLQIEYVPKEQLKPYANNAKLHPAEQVEQIKNSIEKFDFNDPIAVWKDNIVIEGHGSLLAAMEMDDIKEVPVIRLDHLSDKERKAYTIAHNKLTMNTNFEQALLAEELKDVLDEIDMTDLGFGDFELTVLTEDYEPEPFDNELIEQYDGNGEAMLAKKRVIITYDPDAEDRVKELLGVDEIKKVVFDIEEIH